MRKALLLIVFLGLYISTHAQQLYELRIHQSQILDNYDITNGQLMTLPNSKFTVMMGGLNNWDGLGNYFNIYGSKLIVDRLDLRSDGSKHVVLRREDGRKFYDRFPTISATLIPVHHRIQEMGAK